LKSSSSVPSLEDTIAFVVEAHKGQVDKAGLPYVIHLFRVMLRAETEEEMIVCLLHDIVEDTSVTEEELLARGYAKETVSTVMDLTRRDGENYSDYILRVCRKPEARRIKKYDLDDHLDYFYNKRMSAEHAIRYRKAYDVLNNWRD
jgi:guanosine-3',5'-bis(diphosphate) 3'-pyrophosphohydrolase